MKKYGDQVSYPYKVDQYLMQFIRQSLACLYLSGWDTKKVDPARKVYLFKWLQSDPRAEKLVNQTLEAERPIASIHELLAVALEKEKKKVLTLVREYINSYVLVSDIFK